MILTIAIGSAIIGAAFWAVDGSKARRVWTPTDNGVDGEIPCAVCGTHLRDHRIVCDGDDQGYPMFICPHTADSLTTEQILEWHHAGGAVEFALDASAELRNNMRSIGLRWEARNDDSARRHIADDLNRKESK